MILTPKEKAKELVAKFQLQMPIIVIPKLSTQINQYSCDIDLKRSITNAKQCAIVAVERNINTYTDLVNSMSDFSNESRQVIYQLIENEQKLLIEIEKL